MEEVTKQLEIIQSRLDKIDGRLLKLDYPRRARRYSRLRARVVLGNYFSSFYRFHAYVILAALFIVIVLGYITFTSRNSSIDDLNSVNYIMSTKIQSYCQKEISQGQLLYEGQKHISYNIASFVKNNCAYIKDRESTSNSSANLPYLIAAVLLVIAGAAFTGASISSLKPSEREGRQEIAAEALLNSIGLILSSSILFTNLNFLAYLGYYPIQNYQTNLYVVLIFMMAFVFAYFLLFSIVLIAKIAFVFSRRFNKYPYVDRRRK